MQAVMQLLTSSPFLPAVSPLAFEHIAHYPGAHPYVNSAEQGGKSLNANPEQGFYNCI